MHAYANLKVAVGSIQLAICRVAMLLLLVSDSDPDSEDAGAEVVDHERESLAERHLGLPPQQLLGAGDVRLALVRVVGGVGAEHDARAPVDGLLHHLGQLQHRELARVPQVERAHVLLLH